jgi:hypothetical protein
MAQSPYLTDETVLGASPDLMGLDRQRKLAEALTSQAFSQPQGQMISGHYVAPSWTQQLAPALSAAIGMGMNESLDKKQLTLAQALRKQETDAIEEYQTIKAEKGNAAANAYLAKQQSQILRSAGLKELLAPPQTKEVAEGGKVFEKDANGQWKEVATGGQKYRAPIQIDTGTAIELRDPLDPTKVISRMPKSQMPSAGQVVETANGPMLINTRTGQAQPIMAGGQPIAPKLSAEQNKDIISINQQRATIEGALSSVKANPSAFSFGRGAAQNLPYGESLAGRTDKPENAAARAYVFNNVSAVIKERAGTAQSAQELQRINSFMPAVTDNAKQIENKLSGFNTYLQDLEKGTRVNPNMPMQSQMPQAPQNAPQNAPQLDPKLLQYMTPEQRKLFGG